MRVHVLRRRNRKTEEVCCQLSEVDLRISTIGKSVPEIQRPMIRPLVVGNVLCLDECHVWKVLLWAESVLYGVKESVIKAPLITGGTRQ